MPHCRNCLLPAAVPGADVDQRGICAPCRNYSPAERNLEEETRRQRQADLEAALEQCRVQGEYDCISMLSGGKDSCYLIYRLKEQYDLNVLGYTVNVNIPKVAWANIRQTIERLDVPHLTYTPPKPFYRKLFRFLLQNQTEGGAVRTVCYVCAALTEGYALRLAVEKRIPLILAGYSPGQPDPDRMVYEFPQEMICKTDWTPPEMRESADVSQRELELFWNPCRYPENTVFPRYLAPFHAWDYSQAEVMKLVVKLGLISDSRHASPVFSNCPVNWLLMYSDLKNLGYNPYMPEFSAMIRAGKASRWYWRLMTPLVNFMIRRQILLGRNVKKSLKWLGLKTDDLRITRAT